jgi:hypothetical protein
MAAGPGASAGGVLRTSKRSEAYLASATQLDVRGQSHAKVNASAIIEAIAAEFDLGDDLPVGLLAQCFLGAPYDVHVLELTGDIVRHYAASEALPALYAGARKLALHPAYIAIEVYPTGYACLRADGTLVEVPETEV